MFLIPPGRRDEIYVTAADWLLKYESSLLLYCRPRLLLLTFVVCIFRMDISGSQ